MGQSSICTEGKLATVTLICTPDNWALAADEPSFGPAHPYLPY